MNLGSSGGAAGGVGGSVLGRGEGHHVSSAKIGDQLHTVLPVLDLRAFVNVVRVAALRIIAAVQGVHAGSDRAIEMLYQYETTDLDLEAFSLYLPTSR